MLKPAESAERQPNCPDSYVWHEIAAGLTPPVETLAFVEHASCCEHCGPLLRDAVVALSALNGETSEADRQHIASLRSASSEWQQTLAQRIATSPPPAPDRTRDRKSAPWWQPWLTIPRLVLAGASFAALIAASTWFSLRQQPTANQLLARAYTEQRTIELRLAGADYAPLRVSLGPAASFTGRPAALLKAEDLIAGQLPSHPDDANWLQAQAQADVLDGKYDAAAETLLRALELAPNSPALQIDLATAYFERAQSENKKDDFGTAYEYLSQALKTRPDDPVALFNRAIVAEHQHLYQQSLDDSERYLRLDSTSQWAEEARNRANAVRGKLQEHSRNAGPLLNPVQIALLAHNASLASQIDARVEEYLQEAVLSWLPQAFPELRATADPNARQALFFLADLTSREHADHWLADLLRTSSAPKFPRAVAALARAVRANRTDDYEVGREQAVVAERLYRRSGNTPGALRAEFERLLSEQLLRHTEDCHRRTTTALSTRYDCESHECTDRSSQRH